MSKRTPKKSEEAPIEEPQLEQTPIEEQDQDARGEGQTQDEAAGKLEDADFGGGEAGQADIRYSPGAETINPAFVTRNQGEGEDSSEE